MKAFTLACFLALATFSAQAATLTMPTLQNMDSYTCVGGTLQTDHKVTSTDPATGYITGLVFEQDKCTSSSGKVTVTGYHSVCAQVEWDGNGVILSIDVLSSSAGRLPVAYSTCLSAS